MNAYEDNLSAVARILGDTTRSTNMRPMTPRLQPFDMETFLKSSKGAQAARAAVEAVIANSAVDPTPPAELLPKLIKDMMMSGGVE